VQQVTPSVLIQLLLVTVQAVAQCLIVIHVLILMVYAEPQLAAVMFAGIIPRRIMGLNVQLVNSVVMAPA